MGDTHRPATDIREGIRAALKADAHIGSLVYQKDVENPFIAKV